MKTQRFLHDQRLRRAALSILLLAGSAIAQATAAIDPDAGARTEFREAYALAAAGQPAAGDDSTSLQAYPLYAYLQAMRLQRQLRPKITIDGLDTEIAAYFAANGDALAGRDLRRAWLNNLAERKVWSTFSENYSDSVADAGLRCHALTARAALDRTEGLAAAIAEQYQSGQKSPACDAPFAWLQQHDGLTPPRIERRARALLKAGDARSARALAAQLPSTTAAPLLQWAALIENPASAIDALIANPQRPVEPEALLDGWTRFARKDAEGTSSRFDALLQSRHLDAAAASPYAAALALALSWNRHPAANGYFAKVQPADIDEKVAEWSVRSALWAGDWQRAAQRIAAMPPALRSTPRWRYWAARSAERLGDPNAAAAYAPLMQEDGYYAALAAERSGVKYAPHPQPIALNVALQNQIAALPAIVRAHELFLSALRNLATLEWVQGLDALDADSRVQAIGLAASWGWYDQAVGTATKQSIFNDYALLYPLPYDAAVKVGTALSSLPPELIYGVIRQESLYRADAVSKADARGLMQLLPETAQRTARRIGRPLASTESLFDPMVNVPIASAHLRELVDRFGGQLPPAIAGYNAGPNAAARWLTDTPVDADIWIENIPYNETRTYVQRVQWHALVFAWRRSGDPQKLDSWIRPLSTTAADVSPTDELQ